MKYLPNWIKLAATFAGTIAPAYAVAQHFGHVAGIATGAIVVLAFAPRWLP